MAGGSENGDRQFSDRPLCSGAPGGQVSPEHGGCADVLAEHFTKIRESLDKRLADLEHRIAARPPLRTMLTERDVAELLQCDVRTVRRLEAVGDLPRAIRFGGSKRWRVGAIEAWMDDLSEERSR